MLLGREREQREIEMALAGARSGTSAALILVGEPGIGKTALLDHAAARAERMQVLRARGIESEAQIPFASLLELIRPALTALERIPPPQAAALEQALALRPGSAQDRFAVGAATLSLLAAFAEQAPVVVLIDDAHWLDEPSAQAMLFAVRRLLADPIAVLVAVREEEPSVLAAADLPALRVEGLTTEHAAELLPQLRIDAMRRLHAATGGNPLALLELAAETDELTFAPAGAAMLVPATISDAFVRRAARLEPAARRMLLLAAASDTGDLTTLGLAAATLDLSLDLLAAAERAGLASIRGGRIEFRHVLARSAIYAQAPGDERRAAHRALASVLPDRDVDRRAWHLAAAAVGPDDAAAAALEQAGRRARERSAYASAAGAFTRAGRLATDPERRAGLLREAAESAWLAGLPARALQLLDDARSLTHDPALIVKLDHLAGSAAISGGRVAEAHAILTAAAERAEPEEAVMMLSEAGLSCFYAGDPRQMIETARQAVQRLSARGSTRARFMAAMVAGMASILGGDADAGAASIHAAVALAESSLDVRDDPRLLPWLVIGPLFLRESAAGRSLIDGALRDARARAAVGVLPGLLVCVARDQATSDRWPLADSTYTEAIALARETGQQGVTAFGLGGLSWLDARRGRQAECRAHAAEALSLARPLGLGLYEVWTTAALGELELGLGSAKAAAAQFERQQALMDGLGITDADLSPAPELVESYLRLGRRQEAQQLAVVFERAAADKGQPWSMARSMRSLGLVGDDQASDRSFRKALDLHAQTPEEFEAARTRLAYGERLRRARNRVRAREQLRAALDTFERLGSRPWAERARAELAATGETVRRRDPATIDELTPQELQIALLLAAGKTTRETAAAVFLSPKTVEYHLRHVYLKLNINSRDQLARALDGQQRPP
ncbi:MAG: AAA family ATPase [Solirubrobacteraceae bacterium]|jgi:DNA-binding CsgD family transcriptional regulator